MRQGKHVRSTDDPVISDMKDNRSLQVKLATEIPGLETHYTFDGISSDQFYPTDEGKLLDIPKGASQIRMITYRDGKAVGQQINCPVKALKKQNDEKLAAGRCLRVLIHFQ